MTEKFMKWDITEHLRTREDTRLYLEACAEENPGDGSLIRAALNDIARAGNMSQLAREIRISRRGALQGFVEGGQFHLRHGDADHPGVGDAVADYSVAPAPDDLVSMTIHIYVRELRVEL